MEERINKQPEHALAYHIESVSAVTDQDLDEMMQLVKTVLPEKMQYKPEVLKSCFDYADGIYILVRNSDSTVVGFLIALPKNIEYDELHKHDESFTEDKSSLYVEAILIRGGDLTTVKAAYSKLIEAAKEGGYKNISMHARVSEGLSDVLQKRYGAKFYRRIEDWFGFGEPFDYLEINLTQ